MIGRIYKITSSNTDKIYIGSTSKNLTERLRKHENNYKIFKNGKYSYVKSFDILEKKDYKIQLLEKIEYETKTELFKREGYYILKYRDICVNKCIPCRTIKQYYKDNVEKINEVNRQYYKDNRDKIREKQNEKTDCLCGGKYTRSNKVRHDKSKIHIAFNNQ